MERNVKARKILSLILALVLCLATFAGCGSGSAFADFEVPEEGFYTIYIRTQSRQEIITYIYVEE